MDDEDFVEYLAKRSAKNGEIFKISQETREAVWSYLKDNKSLRKLITTHDKSNYKQEVEQSFSGGSSIK